MRSPRRPLAALLLAALTLVPATTAGADSDHAPTGATGAATSITDRSAILTAQVQPQGETTSYWFEYGATTSYGQTTATRSISKNAGLTAVSVAIDGLTPGTPYHVRVRAQNKEGSLVGADRTFTTATAPAPPASSAPAAPSPETEAAPEPTQGTAVVVAPVNGTVKVQEPGSGAFTTLAAGDAVPVGSVVDARRGTVALTSAVTDGTQTGRFHGALFRVRQAAAGSGVTDLVLRGGNFAGCRRARTARTAARRKPPVRRLWGSDDGGKFRTHGRNSVATVRGTRWVTTDTCAGTRTTVREGAVSVRDLRRHRTVLVRAGGSYLARAAR